MESKKFKCTLLSDIILSEQSATEGTQRTLDYIPGNVFLGIVAGKTYAELGMNEMTMLLFHSGKIRFGDAYPMKSNTRAIRVPASWQVIKGESLNEQVYISHEIPETGLRDEEGNPLVYKQCRSEFIVKTEETHFTKISQGTNFAIKSAYDKNFRRSKDKQMYGYQSLEQGIELCFQVYFADADAYELSEKVKNSLIGDFNIGRSKTAQYGRVKIEELEFGQGFKEEESLITGYTFLYAESRLVFIDDFGQPTATPTGDQLGVANIVIDLNKSQIRTFRYAPYNHQRKTRDADRFGIEKGSVICIAKAITPEEKGKIKNGVGLFLNEGFGKVLINPEFLKSQDSTGKSIYSYDKTNDRTDKPLIKIGCSSLPLDDLVLQYLKKQQIDKANQAVVFKDVNLFVKVNQGKFKEGRFASQWGAIRAKAMKAVSTTELKNELFDTDKGYLVHGVAKDKWSESGRLDALKSFIEKFKPTELTTVAVINLAAEMAKKCRRN